MRNVCIFLSGGIQLISAVPGNRSVKDTGSPSIKTHNGAASSFNTARITAGFPGAKEVRRAVRAFLSSEKSALSTQVSKPVVRVPGR